MSQDVPYYVILTGAKNNAGDYLIKYRAKQLFESLKPDYEIVDYDGWKLLTDEQLEVINGAKALILMGGPSLQRQMYPDIYPLRADLNDIKVPITCMGIGWKSLAGDWNDTRNYPLSDTTKTLLKRISDDGLMASTRDYHSLQVLLNNGVEHAVMTGCPATYDLKYIDGEVNVPNFNKIAFSLGVSFLKSSSLEAQMKGLILELRDKFKDKTFEVVFHHSLQTSFLSTHNSSKSHLEGHQKFAQWLDSHAIDYVDISGSAENLMDYYRDCDLHIGYRVHAHIFMSSISKASVLIAEDGRGKALRDVFNGVVLDAFDDVDDSLLGKVKRRLNLADTFKVSEHLVQECATLVDYEISQDLPRLKSSRAGIDSNFKQMKKFIVALP